MNGEKNRTELSSHLKDLQVNDDESSDIYTGPEAPKGHETNWIKTNADDGWFAYFRLYGPTGEFFDRSWQIRDIELQR